MPKEPFHKNAKSRRLRTATNHPVGKPNKKVIKFFSNLGKPVKSKVKKVAKSALTPKKRGRPPGSKNKRRISNPMGKNHPIFEVGKKPKKEESVKRGRGRPKGSKNKKTLSKPAQFRKSMGWDIKNKPTELAPISKAIKKLGDEKRSGTKRGRGRPKGSKNKKKVDVVNIRSGNEPIKRGPGRPRKNPETTKPINEVKRKRGRPRPRKNVETNTNTPKPIKRGRGRPRKNPEVPKPTMPNSVKRGRGRPKGSKNKIKKFLNKMVDKIIHRRSKKKTKPLTTTPKPAAKPLTNNHEIKVGSKVFTRPSTKHKKSFVSKWKPSKSWKPPPKKDYSKEEAEVKSINERLKKQKPVDAKTFFSHFKSR